MKGSKRLLAILLCGVLILGNIVNVFGVSSQLVKCAGTIRNNKKTFQAMSLYDEEHKVLSSDYTNILKVTATRNIGTKETYTKTGNRGVLDMEKTIVNSSQTWKQIKIEMTVYYRGRLVCSDSLTIKA